MRHLAQCPLLWSSLVRAWKEQFSSAFWWLLDGVGRVGDMGEGGGWD